MAAVEARDEEAYGAARGAARLVRSSGQRVAEDELEGSDLILPPADTSLAGGASRSSRARA